MTAEFSILYFLQELHTPWLDSFMVHISSLGNVGWFWLALAVILLCVKKTRKAGIMMLVAIFIGFLISNVALKNLIERSRPCWLDTSIPLLVPVPHDFSFPSGHSTASFAGAYAIYLNHKKAGIAALVLASLIAFSRMYLFVHFPTDVVIGILVGLFSAWAAAWLWRRTASMKKNRKK